MTKQQEMRGPGRPRKVGREPKKEYHLKFSPQVAAYIDKTATQGYQAYFDVLVHRDMEQKREEQQS